MSDDLVNKLYDRRVCSPAQNSCRNDWVLDQAADRIEELEAERDDYANRLMQADNTYTEMHLHIEELEAKLAKAVAGLKQCKEEIDDYIRQEYPQDHSLHERYRMRDYSSNPARTTLAELKGQDDEQ